MRKGTTNQVGGSPSTSRFEHIQYPGMDDEEVGHYNSADAALSAVETRDTISLPVGTGRYSPTRQRERFVPSGASYDPDHHDVPSVRELKRTNRMAQFLSEDTAPQKRSIPIYIPEPELEPLPTPMVDKPVQIAEEEPEQPEQPAYSSPVPLYYGGKSSSSGGFYNIIKWFPFALLCVSSLLLFVSFFGPFTRSTRKESGASGVVQWKYEWVHEYHLTYVYSEASKKDFAYSGSSDWHRTLKSPGAWTIVMNVFALFCSIASAVLVMLYFIKEHAHFLYFGSGSVALSLVFSFIATMIWGVGCHEDVKTNMKSVFNTPVSTLTSDIEYAWGFVLSLLHLLITIAVFALFIYLYVQHNSGYVSSTGSSMNVSTHTMYYNNSVNNSTTPTSNNTNNNNNNNNNNSIYEYNTPTASTSYNKEPVYDAKQDDYNYSSYNNNNISTIQENHQEQEEEDLAAMYNASLRDHNTNNEEIELSPMELQELQQHLQLSTTDTYK